MITAADTEIGGELFDGLVLPEAEEPGGEVDHVAVRLTAKAVEARVELHARRPVVVERTSGHTKAIALDAVMLRRPFARDGGLDGFKYIQGKTPFGDTRIGGSVV